MRVNTDILGRVLANLCWTWMHGQGGVDARKGRPGRVGWTSIMKTKVMKRIFSPLAFRG